MRAEMLQTVRKMESNNIEPSMINVSFNSCYDFLGWFGESEPDDFINVYNVDIELFFDDTFTNKIVIGLVRCYYLSSYNWVQEEFVNLRDIADALSADLLTAVSPVTNDEGFLLDEYFHQDILYIDEFYINPEYRNKGIGQAVFPMILDVLGRSVGAITIIPEPTEDTGKGRIKRNDPRYEPVLKRMTKFIMKFGFVQVDKKQKVWAKNTCLKD